MKKSTIVFPLKGKNVFLANKKRGFGAGFLNGYGGKQKPNDFTIEHTAIREMEEEGGVRATIESLEKVAIINFFEEETGVFECHIFFCRKWEGEFCETEEMSLSQPYSINSLPYDSMWDADRVWLPIVFSGQKIRAISRYNKGMSKQVGFEYEQF